MREGWKIGLATVSTGAFLCLCALTIHFTCQPATENERPFRIGYAVEAPYAFLSNGEPVGESPDIAKRIANHLGLRKIEWVNCDFSALIPCLEAGDIDMIASGLFITKERGKQVAFSIPTFKVRQGLLVAKGNPRGLVSYRHLSESGVKVAALSGSVEEQTLKILGIGPERLLSVPDALTGRIAVETGKADALALSSPTVKWMELSDILGRTEAVEQLAQSGNTTTGAFAFRLSDKETLKAWNTALTAFIGSAEHLAAISKYGFTKDDLPGGVR